MKINLVRTTKYREADLRKVFEILYSHPGPMEFICQSKPILFEKEDFEWNEFFSLMGEYRTEQNIPKDSLLVCITELNNELNWFSACDPDGSNNIFIIGRDWQYYIYAEQHYPIAFEVIINVLEKKFFPLQTADNEFRFIHSNPIGCINDMCGFKPHISFKMRTADICSDCLDAVEMTTQNRHLLEQAISILESLRLGMVQSRTFLKPLSFEEKLPFTVAITKRKMGMTSQPFRKFLMMIDHFDSLIRTAVILLVNLYYLDRESVKKFFEENRLSGRPALGNWVSALSNLSKTIVPNEDLSLPSDFTRKLENIVRLEQDKKIVLLRNEKRGHGYIECSDDGYQQEFMNQLSVLDEIEKSLAPLFYRFHYYQVLKTDHLGNGRFRLTYIDLSGSNPAFLENKTEIVFTNFDDVPNVNQCFLVTPQYDKWICLDPYLKFGNCLVCQHMRLLIQDGELYLDPLIGHRVSGC